MTNVYEVEVTLKRKVRFETNGMTGHGISKTLDMAEDYSDDFDDVTRIFADRGFKAIDIDNHSECVVDDPELIEEID